MKKMNNKIKQKIILLETNIKKNQKFYPYKLLVQNKNNNYPLDVILNQREYYLSDIEFEDIFEMTKTEFQNLKKWKKNNLKKQKKLF